MTKSKSSFIDLVSLETDENSFTISVDEQLLFLSVSHVTIVLPLEDFPELVELLQKSRKKFDDSGILGVETSNCAYRVEICDEDDGAVHIHVLTFGLNLMITLSIDQTSKFITVCEIALIKLKEKGLV